MQRITIGPPARRRRGRGRELRRCHLTSDFLNLASARAITRRESGLGSRGRRRGIMHGGKSGLEVLCRTSTSTLDRGRFGWIDRRSSASSRIRPLQYSPPIRLRHGPDNDIDIDSKYVRSTSREGRTLVAGSQQTARTWLLADPRGNSWRARTRLQVQASSFKLQTPNVKLSEVGGGAGGCLCGRPSRTPSVRRAKVLLCQDSEPRRPGLSQAGRPSRNGGDPGVWILGLQQHSAVRRECIL